MIIGINLLSPNQLITHVNIVLNPLHNFSRNIHIGIVRNLNTIVFVHEYSLLSYPPERSKVH